MHIGQMLESKYLSASDLRGQRVKVTMSNVEMATMNDGKTKAILYFQGKKKGMTLNKTNIRAIASIYGDDTDHWMGQPIELFEAMVDFQGQTVPASGVGVAGPDGRGGEAPLSRETAPPMQQRAPQRAPAMAGDFTEDAPPPPQHASQRVVSGIDDEVPF